MGRHGSNPLKYQDHRVELRALPLKPMECEKVGGKEQKREAMAWFQAFNGD